MKLLNYIKTKNASLAVILLITMFFTVGVPEHITTDHWNMYSVWDIEKGWGKAFLASFLLVTLGFFVAQGINEWKRGK